MFYIIETEQQLEKLIVSDRCFVHVISNNSYYHPKLSSISLVYYYNFDKGYILSVEHSESFSINLQSIIHFIKKHKCVYVYDKKYHSYFLDHNNIVDLHLVQMTLGEEVKIPEFTTTIHRCISRDYYSLKNLNQIIPIAKHYELLENLRIASEKYFDIKTDIKDYSQEYKKIEDSGIKINKEDISELYNITNPDLNIQNNKIYTNYNLYNQTGRPTNSFNNINFLAIPKNKTYRDCFLPTYDFLVEFDFDSYHPRLIGKSINIDLPNIPLHEYFGSLYFSKEQITDEEYKQSKEITFKQLYGGVMKEYKDIEFFSNMNNFIEQLWTIYNTDGEILLPTGIKISKIKGLNKHKLFNYYIQNLETFTNIEKLNKLFDILKNKKSKLILVTYDSFLFDYSIDDGKELLKQIKSILQEGKLLVKHKWGKNYSL